MMPGTAEKGNGKRRVEGKAWLAGMWATQG